MGSVVTPVASAGLRRLPPPRFPNVSRAHRRTTSSTRVISCSTSAGRRPEYAPCLLPDPCYVRILDTTLRDGEQAPGAAMAGDEKLAMARLLSRLGVDTIDAGFPAASPGDLKVVCRIAEEVGNHAGPEEGHVPVIAALARCTRKDIDLAWEAVRHARWPRVTTFVATSDIHLHHKLRKTREQVVGMAADMVAYARSLGVADVAFAAEDATRSDREFLYQVLEEVIKAGAATVIIADTVGCCLPFEFEQLIADVKANTCGIDKVVLAVHCHNDLGLATANSLAGARGGAREIEVTLNGIGERGGNACLEEVVMAMKCREELLQGLRTGIHTQHISAASKMASEYTGFHLQPHKPIVGANVFRHESGIHQDGIIKYRGTYEILSPEDIGQVVTNESSIVLGKNSGRHALRSRLLELGYNIDGEELATLFQCFKEVAWTKKHMSNDDLEALILGDHIISQVTWTLHGVQVTCGTPDHSSATVKLQAPNVGEKIGSSVGVGPIDAAFKAIDSIIQVPIKLLEYSVKSTAENTCTKASARVVICRNGQSRDEVQRTFSGTSAENDSVVSSILAYLNAINNMLSVNARMQASNPTMIQG